MNDVCSIVIVIERETKEKKRGPGKAGKSWAAIKCLERELRV